MHNGSASTHGQSAVGFRRRLAAGYGGAERVVGPAVGYPTGVRWLSQR